MNSVDQIQEIVDLIVDHLVDVIKASSADRHSPYRPSYPVSIQLQELKNCSLINHAFASRSQRYLFSTIKIWPEQTPDIYQIPDTEKTSPAREPKIDKRSYHAVTNLLAVLKLKPYLATHVHTIETLAEFGYLVTRHHPLKELLNILQSHGSPRNMEFYAQASYSTKRPCPDYSVQEKISAHLQVLKCGFLHDMPIFFIANNPNLRSLELTYCSGKTGGVDHGSLRVPRPRLKSLFLNNSWTVLEGLLEGDELLNIPSPVDFSRLEDLHVQPSAVAEDVISLQRLLHVAGPSLRELTMTTFTFEATSYSRSLDLSTCVDLNTATVLATVDEEKDSGSFDRLIDTLSTIPSPNVLQHLDVEIYLCISASVRCEAYNRFMPWKSLDKVLHKILSGTTASPVAYNLFVRFFRTFLDSAVESLEVVAQEAERFSQELTDHCFQSTNSLVNEKIQFEVKQTVEYDYLH